MWAHGWVKSPGVGVTGNYGLVMIYLKHLIHRLSNKSSYTLDQIVGCDTSQVCVCVCVAECQRTMMLWCIVYYLMSSKFCLVCFSEPCGPEMHCIRMVRFKAKTSPKDTFISRKQSHAVQKLSDFTRDRSHFQVYGLQRPCELWWHGPQPRKLIPTSNGVQVNWCHLTLPIVLWPLSSPPSVPGHKNITETCLWSAKCLWTWGRFTGRTQF